MKAVLLKLWIFFSAVSTIGFAVVLIYVIDTPILSVKFLWIITTSTTCATIVLRHIEKQINQ